MEIYETCNSYQMSADKVRIKMTMTIFLMLIYFYPTPLQCSCLENPMDGGVWWAAVHGVAESDMTG